MTDPALGTARVGQPPAHTRSAPGDESEREWGDTTRTRVTVTTPSPLVRAIVGALGAGRRLAERSGTALTRLSGFVTSAGWFVIASAVVGLSAGWLLGWVEWLVGGAAALVLLVMTTPFLFGGRAYDITSRLSHERVVAGGRVEAEIAIRNRGKRVALPGRLDLPVGAGLVEVGIPLLRAGHEVSQPVSIPTPRRGIIPVGPAISVRTDPVGLLRREHAWRDVHSIFVHPRTVAMPAMSAGLVRDLEGRPTQRLVDADMSFHAIRAYAPGDARRQVHWKSTAKTGQLMVRQFEESRRSRMAVVLSLAIGDYTNDDEFELAVSAAASISSQAIRDGLDLAVITGAAIPRVVKGRLRAIANLEASTPRALLDGFAGLDGDDNTLRLEQVCRLAVEASEGLSIAFLVFGSGVDVARMRQAALAFGPDTVVIAVRCDERAHPRVQPLGPLTVLTIGLLDDLPSLMVRGVKS